MNAPVSRRRGRPPALSPITMDLLGRGDDGGLYLWSENAKVQPMDRFPRTAPKRVQSGHYVIETGRQAVTVYVGNAAEPGVLTVQFMCSTFGSLTFGIGLEKHLLGMVVPDPEAEREISEALAQLNAAVVARQTSPSRRRGEPA